MAYRGFFALFWKKKTRKKVYVSWQSTVKGVKTFLVFNKICDFDSGFKEGSLKKTSKIKEKAKKRSLCPDSAAPTTKTFLIFTSILRASATRDKFTKKNVPRWVKNKAGL